jgi:hypothetical protein
MDNTVFTNISKIIERDSKTTTYKFALLRGVIDIIQESSPYISFSNNRVFFPTGLLDVVHFRFTLFLRVFDNYLTCFFVIVFCKSLRALITKRRM